MLAVVMALGLAISLGGCASGEEATIVSVYQPLASGTIHTWIQAELPDGTTVDVQLPDDDDLWDKARDGQGKTVYVKASGDDWEFVKLGW
jgi:hypothetical protein